KADIAPGLSGICGLVDAVAEADLGSDICLSCAHVQDVRGGRCGRDRADGGDGLLVEDRGPDGACVRGLPDAAADCAEIENGLVAWDASDGDDAASPKRPDHAPLELIEEVGGNGLGRKGGAGAEKDGQESHSGCREFYLTIVAFRSAGDQRP